MADSHPLTHLGAELDRLGRGVRSAWRGATHVLHMDAHRDGDTVVLTFDLPGTDPATIAVTVERNVLTVAGSREPAAGSAVHTERSTGTPSRQVFLDDGPDTERVAARYDRSSGVLTVTIPIAADSVPRPVEVQAADGIAKTVTPGGLQPAAPDEPSVDRPSGPGPGDSSAPAPSGTPGSDAPVQTVPVAESPAPTAGPASTGPSS